MILKYSIGEINNLKQKRFGKFIKHSNAYRSSIPYRILVTLSTRIGKTEKMERHVLWYLHSSNNVHSNEYYVKYNLYTGCNLFT